MTWLLILSGLVLLVVGGELLVRGAVSAARAIGISPLMIGLTLVGFGTSAPELVTSLIAAFQGAPGIAVGNVVGSNIANILLILGVTALIYPLAVAPPAFRRDGLALAGSTVACLGAVLWGFMDRWIGLLFVAVLVAYIAWAYRSERAAPDAEAEMHEHVAEDARAGPGGILGSVVLALVGIAATVGGARLLVGGAIELAQSAGISETVIGLTIVAVGTSLPELVACAVAALRRHADVALGNVIGSNIYNVLGILGITSSVHPIAIPVEIARLDIWVLIAATALVLLFLRTGWTLRRWEGAVFVLLYGAYAGYLVVDAGMA
ncbi:calcium/sodium antiporter [Geminicoccus roseus]|uniref:calcium/sodium antiporter n=1 Tax=Geminicoccus roseus TaxID=404900 RepID=UPI0004213963|nr:calcium/sodium antiporter [Geminicoccus roseus]